MVTRAGYEIDELGAFTIACVPAFSDNYHWLVKVGEAVAVVDPGDGAACLEAAAALGWTITHVLVTHWHPDHSGGNLAIKQASGATVLGPAGEADKVPGLDRALEDGDRIELGGQAATIWHVPGHTLGHIAYVFDDGPVFCGDTLFAMGCGRLFEGTPEQMHASLQRLTALPADTPLYCAHEYTLANARFAVTAEPDNAAIAERLEAVAARRAAGERTVPTTVAQERATNPFVRAPDPFILAKHRKAKDRF
ncbi:hydroxyacylglutathione hydrolase [Sphingomicrobium astaxanthinifaciens]|uniref:hydroxyacylglutathione hydrolase n=1 Tax=Sphingomicrobium astaxanthinifaciens TaxID=1227949 RepID=UPI001FCAAF96|nr:hydroxyacylglutathione hydrolase [Sphingomicrobium astaxanthinifaciens]MCJ7421330.1 hydroxyacylglutathione hydrolase [Sphingomicrobium astaxanthinifaciens]